MRIRLSRLAVLLLAVFCMAAYLPGLYFKVFLAKPPYERTQYSPVRNDFVHKIITFDQKQTTTRFLDSDGTEISEKAYEQLLPFMYYRDLEKWGVMPNVVNGQKVPLREIIRGSQWERIRPKTFPENSPQVRLFPLFESASEFTKLKFPTSMFRIDERMEFIDGKTNRIDEEKSRLFTAALKNSFFHFPAVLIAGGKPDCQKEFDEGYLVTDSKGMLFHIKQVKGQPYVREINLPDGVVVKALYLIEHPRKEFYGYIVTEEKELYQVLYNGDNLQKLPLENYDPDTMAIMLRYTLQNTIAGYSDEKVKHTVAMDRNYNVIKSLQEEKPSLEELTTYRFANVLFPFEIEYRDWKSQYFRLNAEFSGLTALVGILVSIVLTFMLYRLRRIPIRENGLDFVLVLFTGIYGLIGLCLIPPDDW